MILKIVFFFSVFLLSLYLIKHYTEWRFAFVCKKKKFFDQFWRYKICQMLNLSLTQSRQRFLNILLSDGEFLKNEVRREYVHRRNPCGKGILAAGSLRRSWRNRGFQFSVVNPRTDPGKESKNASVDVRISVTARPCPGNYADYPTIVYQGTAAVALIKF